MVDPGTHHLDAPSVMGRIGRSKAMATARKNAAKQLGLDPNQIGDASYREQHLPKLKELVGQEQAFTEATKDEGDESGKIGVEAGDLKPGETLTVAGEQIKVKSVHARHVELEDGRKFGKQQVANDRWLYVEGYDEKAPTKEAQPPTKPTESPSKPSVVPKLAPGVKQGDLLASTQKEDLSLAGEKGTDTERLAEAKRQQEATAKAAQEFEAKNQQGFVDLGASTPGHQAPISTDSKPFSPNSKVRVGENPSLHTVVSELPKGPHDLPDERYFTVRNDKTGATSTFEAKDLTPVKESTGDKKTARDLDADLKKAGMDPSGFPNAKAKLSALKRADAKLAELQAKLRGKSFTGVTGLEPAIFDAAITIARGVLKATGHLGGAIEAALNWVRTNHPTKRFNPDEFRGVFAKHLSGDARKMEEAERARMAAQPTAKKVDSIKRGYDWLKSNAGAFIQRRTTKNDLAAQLEGIENVGVYKGQRAGGNVFSQLGVHKDQTPEQQDMKATAASSVLWAEARGGKPAVDQLLKDGLNAPVKDKTWAKTITALRYASAHYNDLKPAASQGKYEFDRQQAEEKRNGKNVDYHSGYLMGKGEDVWDGNTFFIPGQSTGSGGNFRKSKTFDSPFHALFARDASFRPKTGYTPLSLRLDKLVQGRVTSGQRILARDFWADAGKSIVDPVSGAPVMDEMRVDAAGNRSVPSRDYVPLEISPGKQVAVHKGYAELAGALLGRGGLSSNSLGYAALRATGGLKHGLLLFDTFHASRVLQNMLAIGHGKSGFNNGASILEYSEPALKKLIQSGYLPQSALDYSMGKITAGGITKSRGEWARDMLRSGLNASRIGDALHKDVVANIPLIGGINKFIFDKMTRGAMIETSLLELERLGKAYPDMSLKDLKGQVARDINVSFGNIGKQGLFKNATLREIAQMLFLAPQWVESLARKEATFAKRGIQAPFKGGKGGYTIGRNMGAGLVAYFIGTQLLNYATRGQSTFENQEPDHKLDAWIPDLGGKSGGFFISPLSVFAEMTHDLVRYAETKPTYGEAIAQIGENKLSPLARSMMILAGGRDPMTGVKFPTTGERIGSAASQLLPVPIGGSVLAREGLPLPPRPRP